MTAKDESVILDDRAAFSTAADVSHSRRLFAEHVAAGMNQRDAWMKAHPGCSLNSAASSSSRAMRDPNTLAYIRALNPLAVRLDVVVDEPIQVTTLGRLRKREILRDIAEDTTQPAAARIAAIALDNRMAGHEGPEPEDLREVTERLAMKLAPSLRLPSQEER